MESNKVEIKLFLGLVILAILTRLLPHPPNFAPITSIALFTGFHFSNKRLAIFIPLFCMFLSDLYLGIHSLMPLIYLTFVMISVLGIRAKSISFGIVMGASTLFFIISNLGVWYFYYPHTWIGLSSCFILAIPFFINSLMGDFFYTFLLQFSFNKLNQSYFTIVK
ncbi:MAG: DUF6580 family putative transport protein [Flavobacteriales bacterium]|jgi:hypothetical protein|tara:strand:+ start:198 stop:692 length:495 start_codon:yes stop_codon:yes gene_type:complete